MARFDSGARWQAALAGIAANERALKVWPTASRADLQAAHVDAAGQVEQRAARRLRVGALTVALAARRLWGRSLTEERDGRSAQEPRAVRGHVTRGLIAELAPVVNGRDERRGAVQGDVLRSSAQPQRSSVLDRLAENRRLRAELLLARDDLALAIERLAYALVELAELRKRIPAGR